MEISTVLYVLALASFFVLLGIAFATPVLKKYKTLEHVQEPEAEEKLAAQGEHAL